MIIRCKAFIRSKRTDHLMMDLSAFNHVLSVWDR